MLKGCLKRRECEISITNQLHVKNQNFNQPVEDIKEKINTLPSELITSNQPINTSCKDINDYLIKHGSTVILIKYLFLV